MPASPMTTALRSRLVIAAIAAIAVTIAWTMRFGTDDAYISFVYAKSLVRGDGLTWFGDHVEGYTNFAWVLWIAAGLEGGADPLIWSWVGSLIALATAVAVTYRIAIVRTGSEVAGACAAVVLATNYTFLAFGTSGLETMLQTALLAAAAYQVEQLRRGDPTPRRLASLSVTCAFALWTRLDSAVLCAVLAAVVAHRLVTCRATRRLWLAAIAPAFVLVGGWLAWKLAYYGDVLPNTYYVKAATGRVANGARYTWAFLDAYELWPVLVVAALVALVRRRFASWLPVALTVAWMLYVIWVGGDFMELRFFVPVLPPLAVIFAELATAPIPRTPPWLRATAIVGFLAAWSWHHATTFDRVADNSYDSIRMLGTFYQRVANNDWTRLGKPLHDALAGTDATLACNGAGAIPYYADLPTIDQLGLNDEWVAHHGVPAVDSHRPGHQRYASYEYLALNKVTFVIGTPTPVPLGTLARQEPNGDLGAWLSTILGPAPIPDGVELEVVGAPIDDKRELLLWYLTPSPEITARITAASWDRIR